MKLEELNSMKYGEILKLAKEKLNITRRVSKEILIEKLLEQHQNLLSDNNFLSTDESTDNTTMEAEVLPEPVQKRGRKRGNRNEQKKPLPASKKAKKESIEHTLNSTFSVDEDSDDANKKDLPSIIVPQETIPRKLRGRKTAYLTEESSANDSENEKPPARKMKKSTNVEQKEQAVTQDSETGKSTQVEKVQVLDKADSVEKSPPKEAVPEQIPKRKLKKSTSAGEQRISNELVAEKIPARRTRSSDKVELLKGKSDQHPSMKNSTKSNSTAVAPASLPVPQDSNPSVLVERKTVLQRTSSHPVRSRKSTANFNTPAKVALTPAVSAKKAVQFTASTDNSNLPKLVKRKAAPNFAEIHQKNFMKMESVDEYVDKKRTRTETMNASAKTVRTKSVFTNSSTPQAKPSSIPNAKTNSTITTEPIPAPMKTQQDMKFNFVSGLQKPVFTAKGQVVNEKQRVMATVKENLHNNASQIPAETTTASIGGKRKASMSNVSRDINTSKLSMAGKQILELQMQHRNMKN